MSATKHYALQQMGTGAVDWVALWNDSIDKIEVGRTIKLTAGETVTEYKGFYVDTSTGKAMIANSGELPIGLWQTASTALDEEGFGQITGVMTDVGWTWSLGVLLYIDGSGDLTETKQGQRAVAYSISATEIMLLPPVNDVGIISLDTTSVGNVDAGEDILITYTLPANTLNADGRALKIRAWGSMAANSNTKTIKLYFGATVLVTDSSVFNGDGWFFEATVVRTGASAEDAIGEAKVNGVTPVITHTEPAINTAATIIIKATGEATTTNDIVCHGLIVEVIN